jgi:hypothetical protein
LKGNDSELVTELSLNSLADIEENLEKKKKGQSE